MTVHKRRTGLMALCTAGLLACATILSAGCDDGDDGGSTCTFDQSVPSARYLCQSVVLEREDPAPGISIYTFDPESGPMCLNGSNYRVIARDGTTDELVFFMPGGGACFPGDGICLAENSTAPRTLPNNLFVSNDPAVNPLWSGANLVLINYCDASLHAGDTATQQPSGEVRNFRGLRNVSAAIDVARERYPVPSRIILASDSGGSLGALIAVVTLRAAYPDTPIFVVQNGAPGVIAGDVDPEFTDGLIDGWGVRSSVPSGCTDCFSDGHLLPIVRYVLDTDDNVRFASFTSTRDSILNVFLAAGDTGMTAADYERFVRTELPALAAAYPGRYGSFVINGTAPSANSFTLENEGVTYGDWLTDFLSGAASWSSVIAPPPE